MSMVNEEDPGLEAQDTGAAASLPAVKRERPWLTRALSRVDTDELAIAVALVALCVVVRGLWRSPVEIWGDAGLKWHFARQLAYANDFSDADWSHHMARLGINVPVYLLQRVVGTAPKFYYVVPVAAYTLNVLLMYLVGRRMGGRAGGVASALFGIYFTGMVRSSSQLLPDGISGSVLMLTCFALLRFYEAEGAARVRWLLFVGLSFAWAYACKESNLMLFPGVLLCVWLGKRSIKESAIFTAIIAAYGAIETAGFWLFTKHWSRFAIVQEAPEYEPIKFLQLFDRYVKLEFSWQMLLWTWVPAAVWLAARRDKAARPVLIIPASFLFFLTFMVRHVDPLIPWIGNKSRYLAGIAPFLMLGSALLFTELVRQLWVVYQRPRLARFVSWARSEAGLVVIVLCALLGAITSWSERDGLRAQRILRQQARVLNDAYRRNLPIIDRTRAARGLKTVYEVHLHDAYLSQADVAPKGWLPDVNDAVQQLKSKRERVSYLLANRATFPRGELERLIANDCAVTVLTRGSTIRLEPNERLPESCKAPGGELPPL